MENHLLSWRQRISLWFRLGLRFLIVLLVTFFCVRFGRGILELTMPFLLGWFTAVLLDPLVGWTQKELGGSRKLISLSLIILLLFMVGGSLFLLVYWAGKELMDLVRNWDVLLGGVQSAVDSIDGMFARFFDLVPLELTAMSDAAVTGILDWLQETIPSAVKDISEKATDKFMRMPAFFVSMVFFLLGAYFILADYPALCGKASKGMSVSLRGKIDQIRSTALVAFGGYLKAQFFLSSGVFCVLLLGFLVVGQPYSLLLAFALAALDFIPLLGAGTVMVPWAVIALLTHDYKTAISVAIIWGLIAVYRRIAEPKIVGDQTGLSPILSLFSIYIGMKLGGVFGMILGPVLVLVVLNLGRVGMFYGIWCDVRAAGRDICAILSQSPLN